ncbi:MAG: hypothetical protein ACO1RX_15290 [Candidatus Sericytochromatia bacterium]
MNIRLQTNGPADKPTSARLAADIPTDTPSASRSKVPSSPSELLEDSLQELNNWPAPGARATPEVELCAYFPEHPPTPQIKTPRPSGQEIETILDTLRTSQG